MRDIIFGIVNVVIMIIAFVVARYLVPWIRDKIGTDNLNAIADWAMNAVLYAEQVMTAATGEEKKEAVVKIVKDSLDYFDIDLSDEEIDILIESAVKQMHMAEADAVIEASVVVEKEEETEEETEEEETEEAEETEPESEQKAEAGTTAIVGEATAG